MNDTHTGSKVFIHHTVQNVLVYWSVQFAKLHLASSQACHLNLRNNIYQLTFGSLQNQLAVYKHGSGLDLKKNKTLAKSSEWDLNL